MSNYSERQETETASPSTPTYTALPPEESKDELKKLPTLRQLRKAKNDPTPVNRLIRYEEHNDTFNTCISILGALGVASGIGGAGYTLLQSGNPHAAIAFAGLVFSLLILAAWKWARDTHNLHVANERLNAAAKSEDRVSLIERDYSHLTYSTAFQALGAVIMLGAAGYAVQAAYSGADVNVGMLLIAAMVAGLFIALGTKMKNTYQEEVHLHLVHRLGGKSLSEIDGIMEKETHALSEDPLYKGNFSLKQFMNRYTLIGAGATFGIVVLACMASPKVVLGGGSLVCAVILAFAFFAAKDAMSKAKSNEARLLHTSASKVNSLYAKPMSFFGLNKASVLMAVSTLGLAGTIMTGVYAMHQGNAVSGITVSLGVICAIGLWLAANMIKSRHDDIDTALDQASVPALASATR